MLFKTIVEQGYSEFKPGKQHDALDYFNHLLERVELSAEADQDPDPSTIFSFELEKRLECTQCHRVKYITQNEKVLELQAPTIVCNKIGL